MCQKYLGWVCLSICLTVGSCVSVLDEDCLFFQLSYNSPIQWIWILWDLSHSSWDFQSSSTGLVQSFRLFFFCHDEKEKKGQKFKSSQFISCSSLHLHVSQPCYNSFLLWLLPQSCSTAPGVFLIPTALHNLHRTELYGSHLTSVIWRHNRLFISVAEMASRCCFYDTHSESAVTLKLSGKYWLELVSMRRYAKRMSLQYHVVVAACFKQMKM